MKKHLVIALTATLIFVNLVPIASSANIEDSVSVGEAISDLNTGVEITQPPRMMLFANQTESGGSTYKFVSKQVVNLSGVNTLYQALLAGGLTAVPMGHPVARAMVTTGLSSNFKGYKYMRQTIYKKSDKTYHYYKVIDEFTNNKSTWKGAVTTSYQKVRR
ncbi:hypothetical protein IBB80_11580 [Listeria marthii]|uniref:Uncharacterized protein n=1 Tax=Listeria marthii TaxID=529731 RepID=A0A842CH00_9LIST|nr:hypothetical protein [Listeria marthii]MBC1969955.1 hypothetical protein [Listeria marthii]MBC1978589.1 hypothetical protein [Listeria marthii]MBC1998625.1 hypothetical protein [Listeria marthii]MBC2074061.1 hypothetical protein [Listeria marthii]MBC2085515.1 hypothetical protein [Listeria marthii]